MKKADVKGDIGHFSTENFDSIPGFHLDQSLHLEVDGNINRSTKVNAVLDDKEDQDRRFTIKGEGRFWNAAIGDLPVSMKDTEFALYNKEVRGLMFGANFSPRWNSMFLFSQSKGMARREQFRGAGQQQEFRLSAQPVVQNSERVTIDGRSINRGTDYIIDYEDGILKFLPHLLPIEVTSWVIIEYEVSDSKLAFRRNLYGTRQTYQTTPDRRFGITWVREADDFTPKSESVASGTARPMEHVILDFDSAWRINKTFSLSGEQSFSTFDPNKNSEFAWQDKKIMGGASRFSISAKGGRFDSEFAHRKIGKNFRLVGREEGAANLGERGVVNDVLKQNGKLSLQLKPTISVFGNIENSKTNFSKDPTLSAITFFERGGGFTWKYKPKSQLEARWNSQIDR
ncbi:hypothetical protein HYY75_11165, partial [bacterium]|nr:hypothetical protein [bacterium]